MCVLIDVMDDPAMRPAVFVSCMHLTVDGKKDKTNTQFTVQNLHFLFFFFLNDIQQGTRKQKEKVI